MKISVDTFFNKPSLHRLLCYMAVAVLLSACAARPRTPTGPAGADQARYGTSGTAVASWYGPGFHGKRTASGEKYDMYAMTCAHKTLPFGTRLHLQNIANGKTVIVTVTDRGPFIRGRDIDLSLAAARQLDIVGEGTGHVRVKVLDRDMRYAEYIKDGSVSTGSAAAISSNSAGGVYTVQVAAFGEKDSAEYIMKGLKLNHSKVYMVEKWIDGKRYYRVRVGKFKGSEPARDYANKLLQEGYSGAHIAPFEY